MPARSSWELNQQSLDRLLAWLDPERHRAGERYEAIRLKLTKFFEWRRCPFAEDCVDEAINRVARKLEEGQDVQVSPESFFFGVAQFVLREQFKNARPVEAPNLDTLAAEEPAEGVERRHDCLEQCLSSLPGNSRTLVEGFYRGDGRARIENRQKLAAERNIPLNTLRIRVHRIRLQLETCVSACVEN